MCYLGKNAGSYSGVSSLQDAKHLGIWKAREMNFTLITLTGISPQQSFYVRVPVNLNTLVFQPLEWLGKGAAWEKRNLLSWKKKKRERICKTYDDWCQVDKIPDG